MMQYTVSALIEAYQMSNKLPLEIDYLAAANLNQCERNGSLNESVSESRIQCSILWSAFVKFESVVIRIC